MSNTVITNFTDLHGPTAKNEKSLIVIVNNDGTLTMEKNVYEALNNEEEFSDSTPVSVVRFGSDGRPADATDSETEDDNLEHVNITVSGYFSEDLKVGSYENMEGVSLEMRERILKGLSHDHCYTNLSGVDSHIVHHGTEQHSSIPSSKKITIIEQQIIPKGKKIVLNPQGVVIKRSDSLQTPLVVKKSKRVDDDESTDDASSKEVHTEFSLGDKKKGQIKASIKKALPKNFIKLGSKTNEQLKSLLKQEINTKVLDKKTMQLQRKGIEAHIGERQKVNIKSSPAWKTDQTASSPKPLKLGPTILKRNDMKNTPQIKQLTKMRNIDSMARELTHIPHIDEASLTQILQDSGSGQSKESAPSLTTMVNPHHLSTLSGPLSPSLDLLGGIQPDEEGLSEDLLMHVAQLVESSENLQQVIDKQVLGKTALGHSPYGKQPVSQPKIQPPKPAPPPKKEATQIVKSDGRVITLPPIEAPATRSSKRKTLGNDPLIEQSFEPSVEQKQMTTLLNAGVPEQSLIKGNEELDFESVLPMDMILINEQKKHVIARKEPANQDHFTSMPPDDNLTEDDPYRLWCICRQPHNNRFMICCDKCEDWFHGKCVNITKAQGQQMEEQGIEWTCPKCRNKTAQKSKKAKEYRMSDHTKSYEQIRSGNQMKSMEKRRSTDSKKRKSSDSEMNKSLSPKLFEDYPRSSKAFDFEPPPPKLRRSSDQMHKDPKMRRSTEMGQKNPSKQKKNFDAEMKARDSHAFQDRGQSAFQNFLENRKGTAESKKVVKKINPIGVVSTTEGVKEGLCIVCKNKAKQNSIYCSDSCILDHAQDSLSNPLQKSQEESKAEVKPESRVIVYERKTGRCLAGPNAPTAKNLKAWLQQHPTFEVVRPGTLKTNKQTVSVRKEPEKTPQKTLQTTLKFEKKVKSQEQPTSSTAAAPVQTKKQKIQEQPSSSTATTPTQADKKHKTLEQPSSSTAVTPVPSEKKQKAQEQPSSSTASTPLQAEKKQKAQEQPSSSSTTPSHSEKKSKSQEQPTSSSVTPPAQKGPKLIDIMNPAPKPKIIALKTPPNTRSSPALKYVPNYTPKITPPAKSKEKTPKLKSPPPTTPTTRRREPPPEPKSKTPSVEPVRINVRNAMEEHMSKRMSENTGAKLTEDEIKTFAVETEYELHKLFPDVGIKYKAKYRSLIFNIKDRKNLTLWEKICDKTINPKTLVKLSPEELASQELAQWRDKETKHQLELIKKNELDLMTASKSYVVKTHKGEEVMESKSSLPSSTIDPNVAVEDLVTALNDADASMSDQPKTPPEKGKSSKKSSKSLESETVTRSSSRQKSKREEEQQKKETPTPRGRDKSRDRSSRDRSRSRRRSERKRKDRTPSRDRSKRSDRSKKSRSSDRSRRSTSSKHSSKYRSRSKGRTPSNSPPPQAKPKSSHKKKESHPEYDPHERMVTSAFEEKDESYEYAVDLIDKDYESMQCDPEELMAMENKILPGPQVSKPDIASPGDSDQEPTSTVDTNPIAVWNGCVNMVDVARFYVAAHELSGSCTELDEELGAELEVVGRIHPEIVWDYISKMKRAGNKDISVLRLTAANEEEAMQYIALYSYLSSRQRLGVVKVTATMASIKDFYVIPVGAGAKPAEVLGPIPVSRAHSLLALLVRQKKKKTASALSQLPPPPKIRRSLRSYTPPSSTSPSVTTRHKSTIKDNVDTSTAAGDDGDEPYTPGGSDSDNEVQSSSQTAEELKQKMDELNKKIHEERANLISMGAKQEDVSGSLADIALPSNLHEILASIQRTPPPEASAPSKLSTLSEEELLSMVPDDQ